MFKKILSAVLCAAMIATLALSFSGCSSSDGNYPVTVGQTKLESKPEKVAVLSDNLADIIYYLGYSTQICAISDECTQEELTKYLDSVGSETAPDTDAIINSGAELVLTDTPLPDDIRKTLKDKDIEVINMIQPVTTEQISTLYSSLGKMLGGDVDGRANGTDSYERLISTLEQAEKEAEGTTVVKLVCYLYMDENNNLCSYNNTTCEGLVLDYVCATNVASNFQDEKVDESILRLSNPEYIFYDDAAVLDYLKNSSTLSELAALKDNHTYILPKSSLQRQGTSLISTQNYMLATMFPESVSQNIKGESLEKAYGISITETMSYEKGAENEDVRAIQKRLIDLGYLVPEDGVTATNYYGDMTAEAVKKFQQANGLEATGVADNKTLKLLFMSTTLSAEGKTVVPSETAQQTTTEEATTESSQSSGATTNGYNIDLTSRKSYSFGDEHEDIRVIQQRLVDLLYLSFPDEQSMTNHFGYGTQRGIKLFQESNNLPATGEADYETLKVLFSEDAKIPQ